MRILHVITSLYTGGAEKLMVDILPRLKNKGYDVSLCIFDNSDTDFKRRLEKAGVNIIGFGKGSVYNPIYIFKLIRLMNDYDIVHTHNTAPQLFAALASLVCSVVLCTTEHTTSNRRRGWRWYAPVDRWMYSKYRKIICCSEKARTNLCKFVSDTEKLITINNGISLTDFKNAKPNTDIRSGFPDNSKLITMVAGFRWEKDQDTLIRSLRYLGNDFHILLVGNGIRKLELEQLVLENNLKDNVHFLGLRSDIPAILKTSDYIVMSSHFEGLSLSSVEGMAACKPMLASDVDGLRQVVKDAGLLFEEGNPKELAKLILELDNNPDYYNKIATRCCERAEDFDISKTVERYERVYNHLILPTLS